MAAGLPAKSNRWKEKVMGAFTLPEEMPTSLEDLEALLAQAESALDAEAKVLEDDGAVISQEKLDELKRLNEAANLVKSRIDDLKAADEQRLAEARELLEARKAAKKDDAPKDEKKDDKKDADDKVVEEAEKIVEDAEDKESVAASAKKPDTSFKDLAKTPRKPLDVPRGEFGFRMTPNVPRYQEGLVGFDALAASLDSMASNSHVRVNRAPYGERPHMIPMSLGTLTREFDESTTVGDTEADLVEKVNEATRAQNWKPAKFTKDGALAASAGWCAPSERIYTFCDVPPVTGLLTLPDLNLSRGGLSWPQEPDFTELYATLPFRYTEVQLQANPTKPCVEIPCVTFDEIRAEAIGLCVTAGILQKRGFPELIARYMKEVLNAHQRKISIWSIQDIVAGSGAAQVIPTTATLAASGAFLNSLELEALIIRQVERLPNDALVEGIAPDWAPKVIRADLAYQQGREVKSITDAEIDRWLSDRNIRLQWVKGWQELASNAVLFPTTVDVVLYPAGAWFRHLANVIEVGSLYDKAQLQANRYTELFTEDEYKVARRCRTSRLVRIPLCANGVIGDRLLVDCGTVDPAPA